MFAGEVSRQKISKSAIEKAMKDSVRAELPKTIPRTLKEQIRRTSWPGIDRKIAKVRPKGLVEPSKTTAEVLKIERGDKGPRPKLKKPTKKAPKKLKLSPSTEKVGEKTIKTKTKPTRTFKPAETIEEAEDWAKSKGLNPHWRRDGGVADPKWVSSKGEDIEKFKLTLDQINIVQGELDDLMVQYPKVKFDAVGTMYHMDNNTWRKNFEFHILEDKAGYKGKRWRRVDAEKRVRKVMIDEPNIEKAYNREYSIFHAGEYGKDIGIDAGKSGRALRINHTQVLTTTKEKSDARRASTFARRDAGKSGGYLSNVGEDLESLAHHEFAHAIDDAYNLRGNKKLQELHGSLPKEEIKNNLSSYGSDELEEFIAEGFTEGLRPDARPLGVQVKELIDEIVRNAE